MTGHPLRLRARTVRISGEPLPMGIVNASPDSFSDPAGAAGTVVERGRHWPPQVRR